MKFNHSEAFCVMNYRCKKCNLEERLWNSRDGVTPFIIGCKCGGEMSHVNWGDDRRYIDFWPHSDMRVFVDMSKQKYRKIVAEKVDIYWNDKEFPMSKSFETEKIAIDTLCKEFKEGQPDIIIGKEWVRRYRGTSSNTKPISDACQMLEDDLIERGKKELAGLNNRYQIALDVIEEYENSKSPIHGCGVNSLKYFCRDRIK